MATGATARAVRESVLLNAGHFLTSNEAAIYCSEVPKERWFTMQREALRLETYVYTFMRIAGCSKIIQWGFDETSIDGVPTLNQWVLLKEQGSPPSVTTIECAGIMVGSSSREIADHITASWEDGQTAIGMLRESLGDQADVHVPRVNGGVKLHKLQGVMHDTCNTANKTARLALQLRDASGQLHYGYDGHTRCLSGVFARAISGKKITGRTR
jgi:hypothetical protein